MTKREIILRLAAAGLGLTGPEIARIVGASVAYTYAVLRGHRRKGRPCSLQHEPRCALAY